LGHIRATFYSNYAMTVEEYKDRDEDYQFLDSRVKKLLATESLKAS